MNTLNRNGMILDILINLAVDLEESINVNMTNRSSMIQDILFDLTMDAKYYITSHKLNLIIKSLEPMVNKMKMFHNGCLLGA